MCFGPSWGRSMFESLMPYRLIPETEGGQRSWARNHPSTVAVQKQHGLKDARYGAWGFSPASDPFGGYAEYGVDLAGMRSDGYTSDREKTDVGIDRPGCRSEEHTSELQSLMRISYAVFCLKKKNYNH